MKKVLFAAICAFVGVMAHADAMYWQLADQNITGLSDPDCWTMARIEVYENGQPTTGPTYLTLRDDSSLIYVDKDETGAWFYVPESYADNSAAYSFVLELVNDSQEIQASSGQIAYSNANVVKETVFDSFTPVNYSTFNVGANQTIDLPEPTSGLLMLLGASLLALRRRQA